MRNGASDTLNNYQGGLDFDDLMDLFVAQVSEELQPFPDNTGDELDEDMKRCNADLAKSAQQIQAAALLAQEIYDRSETEAQAAAEMKAYEGNDWLPIIGECLENNDYSKLAI